MTQKTYWFDTHVLTFIGCDTRIVSLLFYFYELPVTMPQTELVTLEWFTVVSLTDAEIEEWMERGRVGELSSLGSGGTGAEGRAWLPGGGGGREGRKPACHSKEGRR